MAVPVRPVKMLVTHLTRSIADWVLPAVIKKFMGYCQSAKANDPLKAGDALNC
jgi:hypothetical protein